MTVKSNPSDPAQQYLLRQVTFYNPQNGGTGTQLGGNITQLPAGNNYQASLGNNTIIAAKPQWSQ